MATSLSIAQSRIETLSIALRAMDKSTTEALRCCELLTQRARQLDSLTSPASDASSMLSRSNANLSVTLILMKEAREKFDTTNDCEPVMDRLQQGVQEMEERRQYGGAKAKRATLQSQAGKVILTEPDVYAAADSMEIIRDAYDYFVERRHWKSAPQTLSGLERLHRIGCDAMCLLVASHLKKAGVAVRLKRLHPSHTTTASGPKGAAVTDGSGPTGASGQVPSVEETAVQTRDRLAAALQNRDLLKSIGEFEEYQPVEARPIREIRAVFDCLGSHGYALGPIPKREPPGLAKIFGISPNQVVRTEKVGSGTFTERVNEVLQTGFPQLDAYGEARKEMAYSSIDNYYRRVKQDRKKKGDKSGGSSAGGGGRGSSAAAADAADTADAAARDAVRCLEHTMVVVAGEKHVYRTIVAPSISKQVDDEEGVEETSPYFRKACVASYSYVVAAVVDRALDILETVFLKEGCIGQSSGAKSNSQDGSPALTVRMAAAAAAAGLRMLDGVRMLGPSLAKLCELQVTSETSSDTINQSLAAILCIAIHRTTVKNTARTLENLAKAIQDDPNKGAMHRPKDASVSSVTADTVYAIRLVAPFDSAYKSVSKRRALQWDPNMGEEAGEIDSFIRFLVMRLLNSLKGKALNYTKDGRDDGQAKSNLFMMNNAFYLMEELGPNTMGASDTAFRLTGSWFVDKVNKMLESEKTKYLGHWEALNTHLTAVASNELEYQKNDPHALSHDSGRLIKQRFSGFNEDFEKIYELHRKLCVVDPRLRLSLQQDVSSVFLPRYRRFYEKYTKIKFSKKHQDEYTKYSPDKIEDMLNNMYVDPENVTW